MLGLFMNKLDAINAKRPRSWESRVPHSLGIFATWLRIEPRRLAAGPRWRENETLFNYLTDSLEYLEKFSISFQDLCFPSRYTDSQAIGITEFRAENTVGMNGDKRELT